MPSRLCFLACAYLQPELEAVLSTGDFDDVDVISFPARADGSGDNWEELSTLVTEREEHGCQSEILGGCCTGLPGDLPDTLADTCTHQHDQCFEYFLSKPLLESYYREGAHLLLPAMAADWRNYLQRHGFDRETAREYFGETTHELLLLDTGRDEKASDEIKAFAEHIDLPYRVLPVGLTMFRLFVTQRVSEWRLEHQTKELKDSLDHAIRQVADFTMAFDLISSMTAIRSEEKIVEQMSMLFSMLFSPSKLLLITREKKEPIELISDPTELIENTEYGEQLLTLDSGYQWLPNNSGFRISLDYADESLGVVEMDEFSFPEYRERYLNISLTIAKVCALSLANARSYEQLEHRCRPAGRLSPPPDRPLPRL